MVLALLLVLTTRGALAQPSPSNDAEAEAKAAMKRGLAASARRDAEAALAEYKKAERLVPDANLPHRYAAESLVELERYEDAIQEYETYLRIKPDVSDAAQVRQRMEDARARIDGTIDLSSSPPGASVFVDGSSTKAGDTPLSRLTVKRGPHTIVLRLEGRKDVVLSPVVRGGQALALVANFADAPPAPPTGRDTPRPTEPPKTGVALGWVALGAGAAALATAFVVDVFVLPSKFDAFEAKRERDDPTAGDALSSIHRLQVGTVVGYAVGGALAATGLVVVLWPRKSNAPVKASVSASGAFLSGSF